MSGQSKAVDAKEQDERTCARCGGVLPIEGSPEWEAGDGDCPGNVRPAEGRWDGALGCGAFGPIDQWEWE